MGAVKNSAFEKDFARLCERHGIQADPRQAEGQTELFEKLGSEEYDLAVVSQTSQVSGYQVLLDFNPQPFYFVFAAGRADLRWQLDDAMTQIASLDAGFADKLRQKYFNEDVQISTGFSAQEQAFIRDHPEIIVAYDPAWHPIEYRDSKTGEMQGIMREVYRRIAAKTGLTFRFVTSDSFEQAKSEYEGKAQMFSALSYDYDWGDALDYRLTLPLLDAQVLQVYADSPGKVVAMPNGYYTTHAVQQRYADSGFEYRLYNTIEDCLEAVRTGRADCTFLNSYELNYYLSIPKYHSLHFDTQPGFFQKISLAVAKNQDPLLFSVMDRFPGRAFPHKGPGSDRKDRFRRHTYSHKYRRQNSPCRIRESPV